MADRLLVIPTWPRLGRGLIWHDEQSRAFQAVALTDRTDYHTRSWRRGPAYNQGQTSECVAFTGKGLLNTTLLSRSSPYSTRSKLDPGALFREAQLQDQWPGEDYTGTSALGLCRALVARGLVSEYRWCFGLDDVLLTLSWIGPVGIGIQWHHDMWLPDQSGYINASGPAEGGHEVELTGIDVQHKNVTVTNSWGVGWGNQGRAHLSWRDLDYLLSEQGDAVVLVK